MPWIPLPGTYAGIAVRLDGAEPHDRTPVDDPATNPLSAGTPNYDFYSIEVVQRIGYDSFTPDDGVLIAKNKDSLRGRNGGPNAFNSFAWVIDAHPEDIDQVDYVKPNGEKVMRTIADYRQLNDALFHAGLDSGSRFEWEDAANGLRFYVLDLRRDAQGIRSYSIGVRSLEATRGRAAVLDAPADDPPGVRGTDAPVAFTLRDAGEAEASAPDGPAADIYRLAVSVEGAGWSARLLNELAAVEAGGSAPGERLPDARRRRGGRSHRDAAGHLRERPGAHHFRRPSRGRIGKRAFSGAALRGWPLRWPRWWPPSRLFDHGDRDVGYAGTYVHDFWTTERIEPGARTASPRAAMGGDPARPGSPEHRGGESGRSLVATLRPALLAHVARSPIGRRGGRGPRPYPLGGRAPRGAGLRRAVRAILGALR